MVIYSVVVKFEQNVAQRCFVVTESGHSLMSDPLIDFNPETCHKKMKIDNCNSKSESSLLPSRFALLRNLTWCSWCRHYSYVYRIYIYIH